MINLTHARCMTHRARTGEGKAEDRALPVAIKQEVRRCPVTRATKGSGGH